MSVAFSTFYTVIRGIISDDDTDFNLVSDCAINSRLIAVLNLSKVPGYTVGSDNLSVVPNTNLKPRGRGYQWSDYTAGYGNRMDLMYQGFSYWFDAAYMYYLNLPTQQICDESDQDISPVNTPKEYARLIYETCNLFSLTMTDFHFKTRSVTETIKAPQELVRWLEGELYALVNGGQTSARPAPLPLVAIGVRSIFSGLWMDGNWTGSGYGWANSFC